MDAYLMYAECFVRGAGGNGATALGYVNAVMYKSKRKQNRRFNYGFHTWTRELETALGRTQKNGFSSFWKIHWGQYGWKGGAGGHQQSSEIFPFQL
jgi:hypothetical protein